MPMILLLLPEIALSLMVLVTFAACLGKYKARTLNLLALALSALSMVAAILACNQQGQLFFDSYRVDGLSQIFKIMILAGLFLTIGAGFGLSGITEKLRAEYYLFLAFATLGLVCMTSSHELLTILMSLEISAFALYVMIPFRNLRTSREQMESAIKYFLFGSIASGIMLYGMSYIFGLGNSTHLSELSRNMPILLRTESLAVVGMIMMLCGVFYKLALFPMHFLTPDVYEGSANETASFIATMPKVAAVAVILRLVLLGGTEPGRMSWVLAVFAVLSMTVGNLSALVQSDLKRLLAYSSIAHAGYVMLGVLSVNKLGFASAIYYMAGYLVMNLACFYVIYQLSPDGRNLDFDDLKGLYRRSPLLACTLAVSAFGMTGIPPTIGFTGKFLIFTASMDRGLYGLVILAVINAAISAFYYLKMVRAAYSQVEDPGESVVLSLPTKLLGIFFILFIILAGILPQNFIAMANKAVAGLL